MFMASPSREEKVLSAPVMFVLVFTLSYIYLTFAQVYQSPNTANGSYWCLPCQPGFHVMTHCKSHLMNSTCRPCPSGTFADKANNRTFCSRCTLTSCPKNAMVLQSCSSKTDIKCLCKLGFYQSWEDNVDPHFACMRHAKCEGQKGELYPGNATHDTQCQQCVESQEFIDRSDPDHPKCRPCSTRSMDTPELAPCTVGGDVKCGLLGPGAIAGIVIGFLVLAVIALIVFILWRRRRDKRCFNHGKKNNNRVNNNDNDYQVPLNSSIPYPEVDTERGMNYEEKNHLVQDWSLDFIQKTIFFLLTRRLGTGWTEFIIQLPWCEESRASIVVQQAKENWGDVAQQIRNCLDTWARECPKCVSRTNILRTLENMENFALKEELEKLKQETER